MMSSSYWAIHPVVVATSAPTPLALPDDRAGEKRRDNEGRIERRDGGLHDRHHLLGRFRRVAEMLARHEHDVVLLQRQVAAEIPVGIEPGQVGGENLR